VSDRTPDEAAPMPWHVINGETLIGLLRRAHAGEDPDLLYIEEYVNSDRDEVDGA
jgi:hypothetical protein